MNKKIIVLMIILFVGIGLIFSTKYQQNLNTEKSYQTIEISGNSMFPLLENGDKIKYLTGYYKENNPKTGDIIDYNYAGKYSYIKQIKATDKDNIEIKGNNLYINGKLMKNSNGEIYTFSNNEINVLSLYIKDGKIPQDSYLIFGDNIGNSTDSRKFGAVSKKDIMGKFFIE
ncbi:MAG: signal peptidase I [Candidatus Gracilibacteria bacterium]|nr:signal peptidase I [Candidatus Gracilibacteria bacterium]